jgi:phosphate-selective porin
VLIPFVFALALDEPVIVPPPLPAAGAARPAVSGTPLADAPAADAQTIVPGLLQIPRPATDVQPALRFVWRDHPSLRAGRNFRLDFVVKVQEDSRHPGDDPADFPTWNLHRARFGLEGELYRHITFQVEFEATTETSGNPSKSPWRDVYVDADYINAAQIRVGKMKIPFGLDQLNGDAELDFVFRSLGGSYLSPGRDIGGMLHGRFFKRGLNYWAGVYQQDGENSRSSKIVGGDFTVAGRLTVRPFRKLGAALAQTEIGTSLATTEVSDASTMPNGLRGRTVISQYTFFEPVFVKGRRNRFGIDAEWFKGPFGASAEYIAINDQRQDQGLVSGDLSDAQYRSWYAEASWVVTGEQKEHTVLPRKKGLGGGGFGAIEIAARHEQLKFGSPVGTDPPFRNSRAETIFPNADTVTTYGVNWYVNRFGKIQFNAVRERIDDIERSPTLDGAPFWSAVVRFQFQL